MGSDAAGAGEAAAARHSRYSCYLRHPRRQWLLLLSCSGGTGFLLLIAVAAWAFQVPALDTSAATVPATVVDGPDVDPAWDLLVWDKALWPREAAPVEQKGPPPKPPKAALLAIVEQGSDIQAAIDFGQGMEYLRVGDERRELHILAIQQDRVQVRFHEQTFFLELP